MPVHLLWQDYNLQVLCIVSFDNEGFKIFVALGGGVVKLTVR